MAPYFFCLAAGKGIWRASGADGIAVSGAEGLAWERLAMADGGTPRRARWPVPSSPQTRALAMTGAPGGLDLRGFRERPHPRLEGGARRLRVMLREGEFYRIW